MGASTATFTACNIRRATCAWDWSRPREGKIGTSTDHALLYCYQYDPMTGKYGLVVMNVLRAAGGLTVLVLGIFMIVMFRRERKRRPAFAPAGRRTRHDEDR